MTDYIKDGEDLRREADRLTVKKHGPTLDLLYQIRRALDESIQAIEENEYLRLDRDYWRAEHAKLLNDSIKHGEQMVGNLLLTVIKGGKKDAS